MALSREKYNELRARTWQAATPGFVTVAGPGSFSHYEVADLLDEIDALREEGVMAWKVIVTAKRSGVGSLSNEHSFADEPKAEELRDLRVAATQSFKQVYGATSGVAVDVTVRRA